MPSLTIASPTTSSTTSSPSWQRQLAPGYRAQTLTLPANEVTALNLPPDHWLLGLEGRIDLEYGGLLWGQLLQPQQRTLDEGELLAGGQDGMGVWIKLKPRGPQALQVLLLSAEPQPWWPMRVWQAVRQSLTARPASGRRTIHG